MVVFSRMITWDDVEWLRAATPSESPTSVKWQYQDVEDTWRDDPELTVTGLSEKPSCEVTISLSQEIVRDIKEPGVAGVYKPEGSYYRGRPVLQYSGGLFTLSMGGSYWMVQSGGVRGNMYLMSGSAPSQCPADPRAARNEMRGKKHWRYWNEQGEWPASSGISVKCSKCTPEAATGVLGYHNPLQSFQPALFTMEENEKYLKMMLKKQKNADKKEKNVMNVLSMEDADGRNAPYDVNSVLESIGEKVGQKKKPKKKARGKVRK